MSQSSSSKGKDASGKRFASLNVNQTFKGTKVENRSAAGQPRHGMQLLGKVSQSRRVPTPAYLPSLKKENLGNDPTVNIVPSGSSGWVKKEKTVTKSDDQAEPGQKKTEQTSEISLRPNAGAGFRSQPDQGKGWGNLQTGAGATQPSSSNLFQREFPKLGVDGEGQSTEESVKGKDSEEKEPTSSSTSNAPPRFGGEKWMPGQVPVPGPGQRPGGPAVNIPIDSQRPMFNGAHMQPPRASQFYPYGMPYMMMPPFPYPYPPNRMPPPGAMGQPPRPVTTAAAAASSESSERPATVKSEDIKDMEDNSDDEGWAGAQEEVDYNVKLKFDESDEEPEPVSTPVSAKDSAKDAITPSTKESSEEKLKEGGPVEAWGEHPSGYQGQMPFRHAHQWMGGPFPHYDPSRGPPPQGFPYPPPWMYPSMQGYGMPAVPLQRPEGGPVQSQPAASGAPTSIVHTGATSTASDGKESETAKNTERWSRKEEEEKNEIARREAARVKLKVLEERIKEREQQQRDNESRNRSSQRERLDSENSDSSKGGSQRSKSSRDMPPRFLKQQSQSKGSRKDENAPPSPSPFDGVESSTSRDAMPVPRIMKRHDSLKSDDAISTHSLDSWANVSLDEQEKTKDTDDVFASSTKRNEKQFDTETASKTDESGERLERRKERVDIDSDVKRKQEMRPGFGKGSKDSEDGSKSSKPTFVPSYDMPSKSQRVEQSRRSSRGNESRRDANREGRSSRDYREEKQMKNEKVVELQDQKKDERQYKRKESAPAVGNEAGRGKDIKQSKDVKQDIKDIESKDGTQKMHKDKAADKEERKTSTEKSSGSLKPKTTLDNFKRLEKTKGKSLSLKSSKTDDREKQSEKSEQRSVMETKKPSAWSQVVSGETAEPQTGTSLGKIDTQPKKSIIEIQKEEEIENEKENLKLSAKEGTEKEAPSADNVDQEFQKQGRLTRDRRPDDRRYEERRFDSRQQSSRRGYEYQGRKKSERDTRRPEERSERRRIDGEDKVGIGEYKYDTAVANRAHDGKKRGIEDRKRRHEETEIPIDPYEKIYSEEVEAEGRMREQKIEKQKSFDRRHERTKYADRGRGVGKGRQQSSRGRGRGLALSRGVDNREGYPFSEVKHDTFGSASDKYQRSQSLDYAKSDAKETEIGIQEEKELRTEALDSKDAKKEKEKENREPEQRGFGAPSRKTEGSQYEVRRHQDRQGSFHYQERGNYRQERSESRRGRGSSGVAKHGARKESGSGYKRDRRVEKGTISRKHDGAEGGKTGDKAKDDMDKEGTKDDDSEYEDDEYFDEEEYTDDYGDESDVENGEKETAKERASVARTNVSRERHQAERGYSKMQGPGGHKSRQREHRVFDSGLNKSVMPPRFLKHRVEGSERVRGKSFGVRGSRGRGRIRGSRGHGKLSYSREVKPKSSDGKGEEYSGDSDDEYLSAEGSLGSANEDPRRVETKYVSDSSKRHSTRGKLYRGSGSRGRSTRRGGSSDHFLADRQQDRVGHIDSSGMAGTLPAAGKASFAEHKITEEKYGVRLSSAKRGGSVSKRLTGDNRPTLYAESHQEFAEPPKKMAKSKSIEKADILRQFDVNNIASVVCIDDILQNTENDDNLSQAEEDDGFVEVCSRKNKKAQREIQKEEEKKKLQEEFHMKSAKRNMGDSKEASNKAKHFKVLEQHPQRSTQTFPPVTSQTPITSVSQSQTSNAAMAAVGGWEPAQALLRGVQIVSQGETLDVGKPPSGASQSPMNAWKRPLSFAASLASSSVTASSGSQAPAPDPKAVGTGKPNTSPAKQLPLTAQVSQPSDGPVNGSQMPYNDTINGKEQVKSKDTGMEDGNIDAITMDKLDRSPDGESKDRKVSVSRKSEQRKINKGTKKETAPRFQSIGKGKMPLSPAVVYSDDSNDKKKVSATVEDVPKSMLSKLKVEDRAPGKRPDGSVLRRCNSESSKEQPENGLRDFDGASAGHPTLTFMHPDTRSDVEKAQSNLKEDILSSLDGSSASAKVGAQVPTTEEESAKDTARSVIKSLGDDDEKNLETRSLPSSTPPLAVDIHPPGPSKGPSSDPGINKGPVISVQNSMSQEVNEMSKKVRSLKVLWDTPDSSTSHSTWNSKDSVVATSSVITTTSVTTESEQRESSIVKEQIPPTPVAIVTAQGMNNKNETELQTSNEAGVIAKKTSTEQQNNVCKVKPQQKQQQKLTEEKQVLPPFSHSHLFSSQFPLQQSYTLSMQQTSSHKKLSEQSYVMPVERADGGGMYSHDRSVGDITSHHAQPHTAIALQQVRSASPLSHQPQQDVLQQNVLLGSIYSTQGLQGTQQNTMLWPIVSRPNMQPATTLSYMSHPQTHQDPTQDLLSSSATFSSTPLYMPYDQSSSSIFSAQRINSQLPQNPPVGLVLQQPHLRSASLLNVMQANQSNKDSSIFSMNPSPNPFQQSDLQLLSMTQSDLTKHVNAKPFQPSSRTPPGAQAQQIINHSQFLGHQQTKYTNQMNKIGSQHLAVHKQQQGSEQHSSSLHLHDKRQLLQPHNNQHHSMQHLLPSHQQPIQQQTGSQHSFIRPVALQQSSLQQTSPFLHQHTFPGGRIASVGPRSVHGKTITTTASSPAQNRFGSMSPVDQNMHFIQGGISSVKGLGQPHQLLSNSAGSSVVQVLPHTQSLPVGQPQNHPFTVRPSSQMQKFVRAVPGPIQRPVKPTAQQNVVSSMPNRPKQPVPPMVKTTEASSTAKSSLTTSLGSSFRNEEHQKMIEETKKYFAAQQLKNDSPALNASIAVTGSTLAEEVTSASPANMQVTAAKTIESKGGKPVDSKVLKPLENRSVDQTETSSVTESKVAMPSEVHENEMIDGKPESSKTDNDAKDLPDIAASAMLNDPSDLFSIIKSRPSLAKAFNLGSVGKEKSADKGREKKQKPKDEKPKKSDGVPKRGPSSRAGYRWSSGGKGDQKTGVSKPQPARKSEGSSEKQKSASSKGKS